MAKLIGTHSGTFHCDEALAIAMLRRLPQFEGATVLRSRDNSLLEKCDIVVDVGGVFDAEKLRFDHHQRGFDRVFGNGFNTKLSSAGLVYEHFGRDIVKSALAAAEEDAEALEPVYLRLYASFIEAIDGIDNGVERYESEKPPRYELKTDLSSRVGRLNPTWHTDADDAERDRLFSSAVELTGNEFDAALEHVLQDWLPARHIVKRACETRNAIDESGRIVKLEKFCPWKSHLHELVTEEPLPLYVLFEDNSGSWRIAAVPESPSSFASRKALPSPWRGLRDSELDAASGLSGGVFVHASGFIGGASSYEQALAYARAAVEHKDE